MPKGSKDGSIYKRKETRIVFKGSKRNEVEVWQYYARVRYVGLDGKLREKKRRADPNTYQRACELKRLIAKEIEDELKSPAEEERARTFDELAKLYDEEYLVPPRYVGNQKVAGMRSHKKSRSFYNALASHFQTMPLKEITYDVIRAYKKLRLDTPVLIKRKDRKTKREWVETRSRSLAAVHRELEMLRRMLSIARHKRWIIENPFQMGDTLINRDDEVERMRVLTHDEERKLLAACGPRVLTVKWRGREIKQRDSGKQREHLRPCIILSIDTAARHGEEFLLRWRDVYLEDRIIIIQSWISKTGKERIVPMPERLSQELMKLWEKSSKDPDALVITKREVKRSFKGACRAAGITDYRWHDNRHTGTMRMLDAIRDQTKVMKITGHTSLKTFLRYVNLNREIAQEAGRLMDERRAALEKEGSR